MRVSWSLSLLLATARGWSAGVTETVDVLDPEALLARWSSGTNTSYTSGLKGGIAWAGRGSSREFQLPKNRKCAECWQFA